MSIRSPSSPLLRLFLGHAPDWYKYLIVGFLIINPIIYQLPQFGPALAGWLLLAEFIFTLAMALKCYPLQPGGLLVLEAIVIGLTSAENIYKEVLHNLPVLLLLIFMVAAIHFMRELLLFLFTQLLLKISSKALLGLLFCFFGALLSAFLDALTVIAVVITVITGFYAIYHRVASGKSAHHDHDHQHDDLIQLDEQPNLEQFRAFLRSLVMHAAVGTTLGGVCTLVGEPQNLLIGHELGWHFNDFLRQMSPVSLPVLAVGLVTCYLLEKSGRFGYGAPLAPDIRALLAEFQTHEQGGELQRYRLWIQALIALLLMASLIFHVAEVGLIGLMVIILLTSATGITEESRIGHAFEAALPFTALLVVFFAVVAVIHDQQLFQPLLSWVLAADPATQPLLLYLANGLLSAISDNVFVATIYITEVKQAFVRGEISRDQFELLAVAINTGTNIPSVATPNGQAAFLFLLTSALAPLIRLSYGRMVWMALPYTLTMSLTGLAAIGLIS